MSEWLFTINDQIREREGQEGISAILAILSAGAEVAPHEDVHGVEKALHEASQRYGRALPAGELHAMAGNLVIDDLTEIHVVDEAGQDISRIPVDHSGARDRAQTSIQYGRDGE